MVAGGISWRATPADFSGWGRVYAFFRRWREHGLIAEFHDRLRGRVRERRFRLRPGHGGGLGSRGRQGLDQLLPRDHPPVQLDLRGLQHPSQTRDFLPQPLHPHPGRCLPLLQHSQHRRHRAPLPQSRSRNKTPHASLTPSQTMPNQRKSSDHVRLRYGF
ncbi:hypothetical protein ACGFR6_30815 [Streptomyces sp. NPDC048567]|uniref:hypothetical protein n=1 Tax=Streptomyces sp. NPDC048567 TaxID=3365570 RepID=UPI003723E258